MIYKDLKIVKNDKEYLAEEIILRDVKKTKSILLVIFVFSCILSIPLIILKAHSLFGLMFFEIPFFISGTSLFGYHSSNDGLFKRLNKYSKNKNQLDKDSLISLFDNYSFSKRVIPIGLSLKLSDKNIIQIDFKLNEAIYKEESIIKTLKIKRHLIKKIEIIENDIVVADGDNKNAKVNKNILDLNQMKLFIK